MKKTIRTAISNFAKEDLAKIEQNDILLGENNECNFASGNVIATDDNTSTDGVDKNKTDEETSTDNEIFINKTDDVNEETKNDENFPLTARSKKKITASKLAKVAMLSALASILYLFVKFPIPFLFPSFLDIQVSDIPALIATFSMGLPSGLAVHVVKILIKLPFTSTMYVGEIMDFIVGFLYIIPCWFFYKKKKTQKSAIVGLAVGSILCTVGTMILNRFMAIPLYIELMFGGSWQRLLSMCKVLFPSITIGNFYNYYIFASVLPFNLLRCIIIDLLTVLLYKRVSTLFKKF